MTNEEIIYREAIAHNIMTQEAADAAIKNGLEIPLHTYAAWKSRGYQVRKGEKAAVKTSLWKRSKGKKKAQQESTEAAEQDSAENPEASGHFFLATAFLFTAAQVEEIAAR